MTEVTKEELFRRINYLIEGHCELQKEHTRLKENIEKYRIALRMGGKNTKRKTIEITQVIEELYSILNNQLFFTQEIQNQHKKWQEANHDQETL